MKKGERTPKSTNRDRETELLEIQGEISSFSFSSDLVESSLDFLLKLDGFSLGFDSGQNLRVFMGYCLCLYFRVNAKQEWRLI
jgi:hypothetical protein